MLQGFLTKLSEIFYTNGNAGDGSIAQHSSEEIACARSKAQGEWFSAIAALEKLLLPPSQELSPDNFSGRGLILSGVTPILSNPDLVPYFRAGIFTPKAFKNGALIPFKLPADCQQSAATIAPFIVELPLFPQDPIASEPFCVVFTPQFGLLMVLGEDETGLPAFQFSFEPEAVKQAWETLRSRLILAKSPQLSQLDRWVAEFSPSTPDYRLVMEFSRQLLKHLPTAPTLQLKKTRCIQAIEPENAETPRETPVRQSFDIELLQALTHEVRTPLTTIRTLTRLLLKRNSFSADVVKRLEAIDRECTDQINRMELIFRAAELEGQPSQEKQVELVPMSLERIFQNSIPQWKQQAQRRSILLDVILPKKLPQVVSDPAMLERVLTGLMEQFIHSLPGGGQIRVEVNTAGNQLKLQFHTRSRERCDRPNSLKALGQLLMFQPETGSLSLNMNVTKNLCQALGGKLTVRQRSHQGEVLTIFLPLGGTYTRVDYKTIGV